ncbi:GNAT family N-acetyltransferase [Ulvibacter litoralis]|uniref:Phosphinothricin acetyltransferase n=1 Tax=Ulvibacter litoralis TaxID=227084 RepID=A0A1G7GZS0_9FLAO|nr:GNAT family N-acetyltransferase [Ulvibacter litoralis]GHC59550.1 N-acetyltransferase [Ulvibacter litoralis]SDE93429.1 phosphinothricin acetyltransferase [Ulvibacter litoralis]
MKFSEINKDNYKQVSDIYRSGIKTENATFEVNVPSFEAWDQKYLPFGRIIIHKDEIVLGWASLAKVSDRLVYKGVAEVSVYVSPNAQGKGTGTKLLKKLIEISESEGIWTLQCGIMRENVASIQLHKKCGFREIGYREKVGKLNNVWRDNVIMERRSKVVGL